LCYIVAKIEWMKTFLDAKFERYETYSAELEYFLSSMVNEVENMMDRRVKQLGLKDEEDIQGLFEHQFEEDHYHYSEEFPDIFRKSLFLTVYAKLEDTLVSFCEHFENKYPEEISLNDLRHKGITAHKIYLKKVIKINFPDSTKEWKNLEIFNVIRNHFAHGGDNFITKAEDKKIYNAIYQFPNLINTDILSKRKQNPETLIKFHLDEKFCPEFIQICKRFIEMLNNAVEDFEKETSR